MNVMKTLPVALTLTLTLTLATRLTGISAHAADPVASTSNLTLSILFYPTGTLVGVSSSLAATSNPDAEKQALAVEALEDSAHYYGSGEIAGVLPSVLRRLRVASPELSRLNDAMLIDAVVEAAEKVLDSAQQQAAAAKATQ